jgi:5-methylcytosine-specific restriction endonuclease McrA
MEICHLQVLRTDASGMPIEWLGYQEAAKLYYLEAVAYTCGTALYTLHGGINAKTGRPSLIEVNSIIATHHHQKKGHATNFGYLPPLCNAALFRRDDHFCLYCGFRFRQIDLSRDHIRPLIQGGSDTWSNVVTACKRCNNHKAGRTPEQAGMQLLAIPFTPTHAEYVYLQGRRVLSDQMEFLKAHFPRKSPLHRRQS